ncbi:hypothetical protein ACP4OV_003814 [Aristida adscensionis]
MEKAHGLVLLGVILLNFQLILGRICRWSTNWFVRQVAEASYKLSNMVASVALGAMPQEHSTAVWILYLVVLNNFMAAYDGESVLQYIWTGANSLLFLAHAWRTVDRAGLGGAARHLAYGFVFAMVSACACCKICITMASTSKRQSVEIAQYMRREHMADPRRRQSYYNASNLSGYRYVVSSETNTTVEDVFMHSYAGADDTEAGGRGGEWARRKDLCLSFALFRLLFRRCHGLQCAEARLQKTRDLVLEGLLPAAGDGDDGQPRHARGFNVVEAELGFLHDHVHGGYVLWSRGLRSWYFTFAGVKAVLLYPVSCAFYVVEIAHGQPVRDSVPIIALLLLHGAFDLLQFVFYLTSDRWMVSYMCWARGHAHQRRRRDGLRRVIARVHRQRKLFFWHRYWQNRIGQYSLLDETTRPTTMLQDATALFRPQAWLSHGARESAPAKLPPRLKASVARVLRASDGKLDGVPSLERAHPLPYWEARCDSAIHKVKVVLKWHIATCYCEIAAHGAPAADGSPQREVAAALSRYCAYLVAFRPELLPGIHSHAKVTFREVLEEVRRLVGDQLSVQSRLAMLEHRRRQGHLETLEQTVTLSDGLHLGHLLSSRFEQDCELLWTILENIWVKLILSVAPLQSQDATFARRHAKFLAHGGEFVTHLWAMLSHAGILEQAPWPSRQVHEQEEQFITKLLDKYA